jgi:hypothetical protein
MTPPRGPNQRHVRYSVRHQARLDAETSAKLEDFACTFHRKRSGILRFVMRWGLTQTQGWTVDTAAPLTVHPLSLLLEPDLLQQVQEAAVAQGGQRRCLGPLGDASGQPRGFPCQLACNNDRRPNP